MIVNHSIIAESRHLADEALAQATVNARVCSVSNEMLAAADRLLFAI